MKTKQFGYGFLVGSVFAGIATLLSAPAPGTETRATLRTEKDKWVKELVGLKDSLVSLKNSSIHVSKEGKTQISEFITEVNESIANWKSDIEPHQRELQHEISIIEETIQQLESELSRNNPKN